MKGNCWLKISLLNNSFSDGINYESHSLITYIENADPSLGSDLLLMERQYEMFKYGPINRIWCDTWDSLPRSYIHEEARLTFSSR